MACELCEWKAAHPRERWNGPDRSHCNECHADWRRSSNAMHCVRCHLTFGSPATCEEHEWPTGCAALADLGLVAKVNRWGTNVWWRVTDEVDQ